MTDLFRPLRGVDTLAMMLSAVRSPNMPPWQIFRRAGAGRVAAGALLSIVIWSMWRHGHARDAVTAGTVSIFWASVGLFWLRSSASSHPAPRYPGGLPDIASPDIAAPETAPPGIVDAGDPGLPAVADGSRQAEKMETIGRCTSEFAHDFNNLLSVIICNIDRAARSAAAGTKASAYLADAALAGQRAAGLVADILAFSREQPARPQLVDIDHLLVAMRPLILSVASGCAVDFELGCKWHCRAAPNQLENAVLNLVVNARDAMPTGGHLTIRTLEARVESDDASTRAGEYVGLTVSDTGVGMPPEVASRAFEPFFTTKPLGRGTGLGLSQIAGFARRAAGSAFIETAPGLGTCVTMRLPRGEPDGSRAEDCGLPEPVVDAAFSAVATS